VVFALGVFARSSQIRIWHLKSSVGLSVSLLPTWSKLQRLDADARPMHGLCMPTKTISIEVDAYDLLKMEKRTPSESFSQVVRRLVADRPALTAGELEEAMKPFLGKGAGPKRVRRRAAA